MISNSESQLYRAVNICTACLLLLGNVTMFPTSLESLASLFLISLTICWIRGRRIRFSWPASQLYVLQRTTNKSRSRKGSTYTVAYTCIRWQKNYMNLQTQMSCVAHIRTRRSGTHTHKNLSKQDQQLKYEQTAAPVPPAFLHSAFGVGGHYAGFAGLTHWLYPSLFRSTLPNTLILQAPRAVQGPDTQVESESKLSKTQALLLKE